MSFIQNLFTSRDNNANAATFVGQQDRIWWDPVTNAFYYSDGNTAGGILITGGGSGNGIPGGVANTIQINDGTGNFTGSSNLTFSSGNLFVGGNIVLTGTLFANTNIDLGNLRIVDETIYGLVDGRNITITPSGTGNLVSTGNIQIASGRKLSIGDATIQSTDNTFQFDSNAVPEINNALNLGSTDYRWKNVWVGPGTITITDEITGADVEITARNGNVVLLGTTGLDVGQFTLFGNTIAIKDPDTEISIGTEFATGNVNFFRPIRVFSNVALSSPVFQVDRNGLTQINVNTQLPATQAGLIVNGSDTGNTYPRNFTGTLLQLTNLPNAATRVSGDSFGVDDLTGQNAYFAIASRVARGTVDNPQQTQANDLMMRLTSQGFTNANTFQATIVRYNQIALENFTSTAAGTRHNFMATPVGTATIKNIANIDATGLTFSSSANGGPTNTGITFQDGTFQNTAFVLSNAVSTLTAGAGISVSSPSGDITITNTGVLDVLGTPKQVLVTSNVGGVYTLGTPQDIDTTSNVVFNTLTVNNLNVTGNISNLVPQIINGPVVYVANTATNYNDINDSGLVAGNIANGYAAGMLYNTSTNTWNFDYGNSYGITANTIYSNIGKVENSLQVGYGNATVSYPDASVQVDCNIDSDNQILIQNHYQGPNASADLVAVANNGDSGNFYINVGINSNVYANADYAVTKANDGYMFVNGGNLVVGTQSTGKVINFFTSGTNSTSYIRARINDTGFSATGNILSGAQISATGNVTGSYILGNGRPLTGINAFGNVYANGTVILATTSSDAMSVAPGNNIVITGNNSSKTMTVAVNDSPTFGNITVTGNINGTISGFGPQYWWSLKGNRALSSGQNLPVSIGGFTNGLAVEANTRYQYEILFNHTLDKAGSLSYFLSNSGGISFSAHSYQVNHNHTTGLTPQAGIQMMSNYVTSNFTTPVVIATTDNSYNHAHIWGIVDVANAGNLNFMMSQDQTSVAWTMVSGAYIRVQQLGGTTGNTTIGTWT